MIHIASVVPRQYIHMLYFPAELNQLTSCDLQNDHAPILFADTVCFLFVE